MSAFGVRLKRWRRRAGLTQAAAAARLTTLSGVVVPASTYRKWEQGVQTTSPITAEFVKRIVS